MAEQEVWAHFDPEDLHSREGAYGNGGPLSPYS